VLISGRCLSSNQKRPSAWTRARKRICHCLSFDERPNPPGPAATEAGSPGPPRAVGVARSSRTPRDELDASEGRGVRTGAESGDAGASPAASGIGVGAGPAWGTAGATGGGLEGDAGAPPASGVCAPGGAAGACTLGAGAGADAPWACAFTTKLEPTANAASDATQGVMSRAFRRAYLTVMGVFYSRRLGHARTSCRRTVNWHNAGG
jgi:hypothetical protein